MNSLARDPGSFRDRSGHVYHVEGRVLRSISAAALEHLKHAEASGCVKALAERDWLIDYRYVDPADFSPKLPDAAAWVEHPRIEPWTYPYEWPSLLLREAALLHLDIVLLALEHDVVLSDSSAYNLQFVGSKPVYIDLLSLRRYEPGAYWAGHRQFCEQFLAPLLLDARWNIAWQPWFRGGLEGIPLEAVARLCRSRDWLSLRMAMHVLLPARLASRATSSSAAVARPQRPLPKAAYANLVRGLREWIHSMPGIAGTSVWKDYATSNTYANEEREAKRRLVADFVGRRRPNRLIDLGCNSGDYSEVALSAGAKQVVGFDADRGALAAACQRSKALAGFLPLYMDAANPSPEQGWFERERRGFSQRFVADAVIALAFAHHLAVGRNAPIDETVAWIVRLAPSGLIEFVEPDDPTVQKMLRLRDGPLPEWDRERFEQALGAQARIVASTVVSAAGRRLYEYERSART